MKVLLVGGCGYVGSYLYDKLKELDFDVKVSDIFTRGNPMGIQVAFANYALISIDDLAGFDAVLWFGGHSSVPSAVSDPIGALENNAMELYKFRLRLPERCRFIYASTASLYSINGKKPTKLFSNEESLVSIPAQNPYDCSKFIFDYISEKFLPPCYCLRMGTLAGFSPNLRKELLFNAMSLSASTRRQIYLRNATAQRTILYLADLWTVVYEILVGEQEAGVFNVGSYSGSIGEFAESIANAWDAEIVRQDDTPTYSFMLDTSRIKSFCGDFLVSESLADMSRRFVEQYRKAGAK